MNYSCTKWINGYMKWQNELHNFSETRGGEKRGVRLHSNAATTTFISARKQALWTASTTLFKNNKHDNKAF